MRLISSPAEVLNQGYALVDLGYGLPPAKIELADTSMSQQDENKPDQ